MDLAPPWVLVAATLMAGLVQYLSAKVGWLTGESLPALVGRRTRTIPRLGYRLQAEAVAVATDVAEIVGGAVSPVTALRLTAGGRCGDHDRGLDRLAAVQESPQPASFERVITGMLAVVAIGFPGRAGHRPPDPGASVDGLVPRLAGTERPCSLSACWGQR